MTIRIEARVVKLEVEVRTKTGGVMVVVLEPDETLEQARERLKISHDFGGRLIVIHSPWSGGAGVEREGVVTDTERAIEVIRSQDRKG